MATQKQKKLAQALIENLQSEETKTAGEILETIGYSKNTAEAIPGEIIKGKGVQEELVALGFNELRAKQVVSEIMESSEDHNRLKAADMIFKVQGSYAPEKSISLNLNHQTSLTAAEIAEVKQRVKDKQIDGQDNTN